jgi:hypothetical protein
MKAPSAPKRLHPVADGNDAACDAFSHRRCHGSRWSSHGITYRSSSRSVRWSWHKTAMVHFGEKWVTGSHFNTTIPKINRSIHPSASFTLGCYWTVVATKPPFVVWRNSEHAHAPARHQTRQRTQNQFSEFFHIRNRQLGFHEINFFTFGIISVNFLPFGIISVGFHEIDFFTFGIISVNFLPFGIISVGFHEIDFFTFGIISVNFLPFGIISVGFHEIDFFTFGIISVNFLLFGIISVGFHEIDFSPSESFRWIFYPSESPRWDFTRWGAGGIGMSDVTQKHEVLPGDHDWRERGG